MVVTPAAAAARRRVASLAPEAPATMASGRIDRWVGSLALPGDPEATVRLVRSVALGVPFVATLAGGARAALLAVAALGVAGVSLHRTAPARRTAAYERELPALLEGVARQLRAGGSLGQAVAATRPPEPTCSSLPADWRRVVELAPAVGVTAALDDWAARAGSRPSVHLASAALAMAAETGGSSARAVDGVASTLRSRLAVADEVRALSSQARASALVIAAAPVVFGAAAGVTDARTAAFFATPVGVTVLAAGLGLDALGAWWMSRLCRSAA